MTFNNLTTTEIPSDDLKNLSSDLLSPTSERIDQTSRQLDGEGATTQAYYSVKEAANLLGVSEKTIRRWTNNETKQYCLMSIRTLGGHRRIPESEVLRIQLLRSSPGSPPTLKPVNEMEKDLPSKESPPEATSEDILLLKTPSISLSTSEEKNSVFAGEMDVETPSQGLRAIKNLLKVLKALLNAPIIHSVIGIVLGWIIQLVGEVINGHQELQPLYKPWVQLQAAFLELDLQSQDGLRQLALKALQSGGTKLNTSLSQATGQVKKGLNKAFIRGRQRATTVFWELVRAQHDEQRPETERRRARRLVEQILTPYQRLTQYLAKFSPGTLAHDVCKLLLTARPRDYKILRTNWSVRTLAYVCKTALHTTSASKSQVQRFLSSLKWYRKPQVKLLSSDVNFGKKMKLLGNTFLNLKDEELVVFGDGFDYTSRKVQEHLDPKYAPEGLQIRLKAKVDKFYRAVCKVPMFGLFAPQVPWLETAELPSKEYDEFLPVLVELLKRFVRTTPGTVYVVLDNAPYHKPHELPQDIQKIFKKRVEVLFLPTYSPELNPIEGIWQKLLEAVDRHLSDMTELHTTLLDALAHVRQHLVAQGPQQLNLRCPVCGHKFEFKEEKSSTLAHELEKHLCFTIPDLNPYVIQILTHSLEASPV